MIAFFALLIVPLAIINSLAGFVSFFWLLWLGQWTLALLGLLALVISPFTLSIALMPGMLVGIPAAALVERGHRIAAVPLAFLSHLYTHAVMFAWCVVVIYFAAHIVRLESAIPIILGSYSISTSPWAYLASKDGPESNSVFTVCALELGWLVALAAWSIYNLTGTDALALLAAIMIFSAVFQTLLTFIVLRTQHPREHRFEPRF